MGNKSKYVCLLLILGSQPEDELQGLLLVIAIDASNCSNGFWIKIVKEV